MFAMGAANGGVVLTTTPDPGPMPEFLVRAPALGPHGDSLDDLEAPFGVSRMTADKRTS